MSIQFCLLFFIMNPDSYSQSINPHSFAVPQPAFVPVPIQPARFQAVSKASDERDPETGIFTPALKKR